MMNSAKLPANLRNGLWTEAALCATFYENVVVTDNRTTPAYELLYRKEMGQVRYLHSFGDMAVFAIRDKIQGKLKDRGQICMFLGYSEDHDTSTYRMLNINTRKVIHTRDLTWLNKTYGEYYNVQQPMIVEIEDDEDEKTNIISDEESVNSEGREPGAIPTIVTPTPTRPRQNTRLLSELRRLATSYNEDATDYLETAEENLNTVFEESIANNETGRENENENANAIYDTMTKNFAFMVGSVLEPTEPIEGTSERKYGKQDISFQEAWHHPDPEIRLKWREAIKKEFHCMNKRHIWRKVK